MKRLSIILTLMLVVTCALTACGEGEAYKLYSDMNAAMESVTSMQATVDAKVGIESGGENIDMSMQMTIKEIIHSETNVEMTMLMTVDVGSLGSMDAKMYFKDGWMYQDVMGVKSKTAVSIEDALKQANALSAFDFGKDAISKSKVEAVSKGKQLSFTLNGSKLSDVLNEIAGSMLESLGGAAGMDLKFSDVDYSILLSPDNLPLEQRIVFTMEMQIDGETAKVNYDMNMTGFSYNSISELYYPDDLDTYTEM